jgi:hypothetical protein
MLLAIDTANLPLYVAILVPVAVLVYYLGNVRAQRGMSERSTEPRGRRGYQARRKDDPQFAAMVGRMMERGLVTKIGEASAGPVLVRGVLTTADTHPRRPAGARDACGRTAAAPGETPRSRPSTW